MRVKWQLHQQVCYQECNFKMLKKTLRKKYKKLRSELTAQEISEYSLDIADRLIQSFNFEDKKVHVFLPIFSQKEINTWLTVDRLMSIGQVIVSRADFDSYEMTHVKLTNDVAIETNSYGIPEPIGGEVVLPKAIDVVLVPLLAFDKKGYRTGYGKGFYDRFLNELNPNAIKIGLSFFEVEEEEITDVNDFDVLLNYCVTPNILYTFD